MATWTNDELDRIDAAQELTLASGRANGSWRRPVTMWVVRHGEDVYVRSVNGRGSSWFKGAQTRPVARIRVGGVEEDVSLVGTDEAAEEIDAAVQTKYGRPRDRGARHGRAPRCRRRGEIRSRRLG